MGTHEGINAIIHEGLKMDMIAYIKVYVQEHLKGYMNESMQDIELLDGRMRFPMVELKLIEISQAFKTAGARGMPLSLQGRG